MDTLSATSTSLADLGPFAQLVDMGGPVMIILIAIAAAGAVTFVYLMLFGALYAPRLSRPLRELLAQWQAEPAQTAPEQLRSGAGILGRKNPMMHLLVDTMNASRSAPHIGAVRETAVRDAQAALEPFEAPLKIIEVIAALAPLLGLLGTVMGMMEAFSAMAASDGRANASQLSGGIYEALTTTAAGLVVAIPFAALAAWIEFRLRRIHKTINSALVSVFNVLPDASATDSETAPESPRAEQQETSASKAAPDYSFNEHQRLAHAAG
ncbi:MotA/TolQ/ExbB proton channel family protein [Marinobacter sp. VGCF2001]|uniref:MotA/TolQ/ExbB proton channel family protein n=1 Tax=Marinobacter sp. VGCF2001 TaxID=3417189 RepID=UPI003CFAA593